jgi:hypothetical protein
LVRFPASIFFEAEPSIHRQLMWGFFILVPVPSIFAVCKAS